MSRNESGGVIQINEVSVYSINQALMQVLEQLDTLRGFRGNVTIHDRQAVDASQDMGDALTRGEFLGEIFNLGQPWQWRPGDSTLTDDMESGGVTELSPFDPFVRLLTETRFGDTESMAIGGGVELWTTPVSRTTGIAAVNLNAGANVLGSAIDNSVNKDTWATISATFLCGTAPTAGTEVEVYLLYAPDGTNYQDGDASPIDPVGGYVGSFIARNVTTQQYPVALQVPLQPFKFKILLKSELNQNISSTSLTVLCQTYNKVQS